MARRGFGDMREARPYELRPGVRSISFTAFDTNVYLDVWQEGSGARPVLAERDLDAALLACRDRCAQFERTLSRMRDDSDISRAAARAPEPVEVSRETAELVRLALGYCERSGGLFDVTMGTVTRLWDFRERRVPSRAAVADALAHVGWRSVEVNAEARTLALRDPYAVLDLGGIAKGYIADALACLLEGAGVRRFVLNLGGNVLVRGGLPDGLPHEVGIADPYGGAAPVAAVDLDTGSVVTSGAYERRFAQGGKVHHHILDPRTGFPAVTDAASATIVSARSIDGDAYATTAFILGVHEGLAFIEGLEGVEAVMIDELGRLRATSGLAGRLRLLR